MFRKTHDGKIPIPHRASLRKRRRTDTATESEGRPEGRTRQADQNELLQNPRKADARPEDDTPAGATARNRAENSRRLDGQEKNFRNEDQSKHTQQIMALETGLNWRANFRKQKKLKKR